jgi:hypothetical protein
MTHDPTRDCEHGRLKGKCDVCDLQEEVERLTDLLNNPEDHYPGNFDTPQRANALLTGLCQDAANEIAKLQYEVDAIPAIKEERDALAAEVLEQCRINGMSAEREDALRAELTQLKASIVLDKMADNARELWLDYEPAPVQPVAQPASEEDMKVYRAIADNYRKDLAAAQPAVQEPVTPNDDHVICPNCVHQFRGIPVNVQRLMLDAGFEPPFTTPPAPQPVPVKTYHDGKPWPVQPKPWVGLTQEDKEFIELTGGKSDVLLAELVESKLKGKNT